MNSDDGWTGSWAAKKVGDHSDVIAVQTITDNLIQIETKHGCEPVQIATQSVPIVTSSELSRVHANEKVAFVMNIPKSAVYAQSALDFAEKHCFGIGNLGDLYTAINEKSYRDYLSKEARFILRGLIQHTKVQSVRRITDRMYEIDRYGMPTIRVLALNEYDLTADALRNGIDNHGSCELVLTSNPNCRPSGESIMAGKSMGIKVLKWAHLLGALNNAK